MLLLSKQRLAQGITLQSKQSQCISPESRNTSSPIRHKGGQTHVSSVWMKQCQAIKELSLVLAIIK